MYSLLLIIAIIVCVLLVLIVLIQNPKGGGLSSNFSSSSQLMGVQKTGDFLEKGTWILAITLMVLSLAINVAVKGGADKAHSLSPILWRCNVGNDCLGGSNVGSAKTAEHAS